MASPFAPSAAQRKQALKALSDGGSVVAVGVISGTSMDAVDVAALVTDGETVVTREPGRDYKLDAQARATIAAAIPDALVAPSAKHRTPAITAAEAVVTATHIDAVRAFLEDTGIEADVIGWHGQTLAHAPERGLTMQIGDASAMARACDLPVVADLRLADVEAGGEGAPLVPAYHRALARSSELDAPTLIINLGGVANITYIDGDMLIAFDTGPASALIDDAMAEVGERYDAEGRLAASGAADENALALLLAHSFFDAPPPKSLDRNAFSTDHLAGLTLADRVATLTAFSARALGRALDHLPKRPVRAVAAGGGTRNKTLMRMIAEEIALPVERAEEVGLSSEFMEAEAFAFLAVRSARGLPVTFPGTTGVATPLTGGRMVLADEENSQ